MMKGGGIRHDYDLNTPDTTEVKCAGCGLELQGSWTDYHGQVICVTCGLPYQILFYEKDENGNITKPLHKPPEISVREELVPFIKKYYEETKRACGLGMFLTPYPDITENLKAFVEWLKAQPETEKFFKPEKANQP